MQLPGRNDSSGAGRSEDFKNEEMNDSPERDNPLNGDLDSDVSYDSEEEEEVPDLDEEDLEENDLTDEEADDIDWDEPPAEGTRKS